MTESTTVNLNFQNTAKSSAKSFMGKLGLFLLGFSFSLWSVFMTIELLSNFYTVSQNSPYFTLFIFASMGSTSLGIILLNIDLRKVLNRGKFLIRVSSLVFAVINILGLILVYYVQHGGRGGINLRGTEPSIFYFYLIAETVIFIVFLFLYNSFLFPFISKLRKIILVISDALAGSYLIALLIQFYLASLPLIRHAQNPKIVNEILGIGAYNVQLANPVFGLPGLSLNETYNYFANVWMDTILVAANILFAYLFYSAVFPVGNMHTNIKE